MNEKTKVDSKHGKVDMEDLRRKITAEADHIAKEKLPKTNLYYIDDVFEQAKETVLISQKIFDKSIGLRVAAKKYLPRGLITAIKRIKAKLPV
ncbi:MAG: hypothetical protein M1374_08130 [Firmicutes bacterium]|nr:hypothetical protein [Bacillota bacterium]